MRDARRSPTRAVLAFVAIVACIGASFGACQNYKRQNGEDCIRNDDCVSGFCASLICSTPGPTLSGTSYPSSSDSGAPQPSTDTGAPSTPDSSTPAADSSSGDGSADGPPVPVIDAGHDAADSSSALDASLDVTDEATDSSAVDLDGTTLDANPDAADGADAFNHMSRTVLLA